VNLEGAGYKVKPMLEGVKDFLQQVGVLYMAIISIVIRGGVYR
jgi:hypothetical protein